MAEGDDDLLRFLDRDAAEAVFRARLDLAAEARPEIPESIPAESAAVSLMITNRQRAELRSRGFSDAAIRTMTPSEAHGHLGLDGPSR